MINIGKQMDFIVKEAEIRECFPLYSAVFPSLLVSARITAAH